MAVGRYVVVVTDSGPPGDIIGGPLLWDPDTAPTWNPGTDRTALPETEALAAGWTYPPPPPPEPFPGGPHVIVSTDPTDFTIYGREDPGSDRRFLVEADAYTLGFTDPPAQE